MKTSFRKKFQKMFILIIRKKLSNKIIIKRFLTIKSKLRNNNKNNINNNYLISYISNDKISNILSDNNYLNNKDFSNKIILLLLMKIKIN